MQRTILHLILAHFSAAVEQLHDRRLHDKPIIIAPPGARAVVHDMSREAWQSGVRRGMRLEQARRHCPQALVLVPAMQRYALAMERCVRIARSFTPLVEQDVRRGHLYLDLTGTRRLAGSPATVARTIQRRISRDTGLHTAWALAPSRLVARVAGRLAEPAGEMIVRQGSEQNFLAPLPLSLLPDLHRNDLVRLQELNIRTVLQARQLSMPELTILCGRRAHSIYRLLRGIDPSPICSPAVPSVLSFQHIFSPDSNREEQVRAALHDLVFRAGHSLRRYHVGCRRVSVHLLYSDGLQVIRQAVDRKGVTTDNYNLHRLAVTALYRAWHRRVRLHGLSLSCSRLTIPAHQLSLFSDENKKTRKQLEISNAIDAIHKRFGMTALHPANAQHTAGKVFMKYTG